MAHKNLGVPSVQVNTDTKTFKALLDTGCSHSLITKSLAQELGITELEKLLTKITFGDKKSIQPFGCAKLKIKFGDTIINHKFIVMDQLIFPCFIGADLIKTHGIEISLKDEKMFFAFKPQISFPIRMYKGRKATINTFLDYDKQTQAKNLVGGLQSKASCQINHKGSNKEKDHFDGLDPEDSLSPGEIENVIGRLLKKYPRVARTDGSIGNNTLTRHVIEYDGPHTTCKPYKNAPEMSKIVDENIQTLLQHGLIRRSRSPFSAPIVLDQKKDKSWRMCIDYTRRLLRTIPPNYWYAVIDCNSGFWQIPLSD